MKEKVAVLYICTGKYVVFWDVFFKSFSSLFLPECDKDFFVFTDADYIIGQEMGNVHKVFQKNLGWPENTLMRFHMFCGIVEELKKFDYIFFFNANMECKSVVNAKEFLPYGKDNYVCVKHPGWYADIPLFFPYDHNKKSRAYVAAGKGQYYVCGGVNGGKSSAYIELIKALMDAIDCDKANGVLARYHDESQINRFILDRNDVRVLDPNYCFPDGYKINGDCKIRLLNKADYIDVASIKNTRYSKWSYVKSMTFAGVRLLGRVIYGAVGKFKERGRKK